MVACQVARQADHNPYIACRVGEADHPGPRPKKDSIRFAIINPTSVLDKQQEFSQLRCEYGVDMIAMAETSATVQTQGELNGSMRKLGYNMIWSDPVMPHKTRLDGEDSRRGKAGGTAIASSVPIRPSRNPVDGKWKHCTRLVHAIVSTSNLHFQLFVIYGVTASQQQAAETTDSLVLEAYRRSMNLPLPAMIMGDFNYAVDSSNACQVLFEQGFQHLQQIHVNLYGAQMDTTCCDSTNPDSALIDPVLVPSVHNLRVCKNKLFATHDVVLFDLKLPETPPAIFRYQMPQDWSSLGIQPEDLQEAIQDMPTECRSSTIDEWCKRTEALVDQVVRKAHLRDPVVNSMAFLPRKFRGRGTKVKAAWHPYQAQVKKGRLGDYEPPGEVCAVRTKKKVTQLRRIQSLRARLVKYEREGNIDQHWDSVTQEWDAICKNRCMGVTFMQWAQNVPELGPLQWPLPSADALHFLQQLFRIVVDDAVYHDGQLRKKHVELRLLADKKWGHSKQAFAVAKGTKHPPLTKVATAVREIGIQIGSIAEDDPFWVIEVAVHNPKQFQSGFPVIVNEHRCWIRERSDHALTLQSRERPELPEDDLEVVQHVEHFDENTIFDHLHHYWSQFWQRDDPIDEPTESDMQEFLHLVRNLPPGLQFPDTNAADVNEWMQAIKDTKSSSAPGIDGIRASELQMMPQQMITELVEIIQASDRVVPANMMVGRTIPMPKTSKNVTPAQIRPITILPQVYRIWAKVISRKILASLATVLPAPVSGFLKKRSAYAAAYGIQAWLEHQSIVGNHRSGVNLDLIKCYNLIRRCFAAFLMIAFGCDEDMVRKWQQSMSDSTRIWEIRGAVSEKHQTTCGCAEGDPIAVAIMVMISAVWVLNLPWQNQAVKINAYADNWSWASTNPDYHLEIATTTVEVCKVAKLEIDPIKTWIWASHPKHESIVRDAVQHMNPHSTPEKKHTARDLGLQMHYTGRAQNGDQDERIAEGILRLKRIKNREWDSKVKQHVIKTSVYASSFYGCEVAPVSDHKLPKFRALVVEAMMRFKAHTMTPVLFFLTSFPELIDPALYIILQAIKQARRWLVKASPGQRKAFCTAASRSDGTASTTKGPATVLMFYIGKLGWQITSEGVVHVSPWVSLTLWEAPFKAFQHWAFESWKATAIMEYTNRFNLYHRWPVNGYATNMVINELSDQHKRIIWREITHAYQPGNQKDHWLSQDESKCQFCGEQDDMSHRLLHCPAFTATRDNHSQAVYILEEEQPGWITWPVIEEDAQDSLVHMLHSQIPEVAIGQDMIQLIKDHGIENPVIFTDGSSQGQNCPSSRYAAFAAVVDISSSADHRMEMVNQYYASGSLPDTFATIARSRLPGHQCIHRAELMIIVMLHEAFSEFTIWTDSAVAISAVTKAQQAGSLAELGDHPFSDLVMRIFKAKTGKQTVVKIKAHKTIEPTMNVEEAYRFLGNHKADIEAGAAAMAEDSLGIEFAKLHTKIMEEQKQLKQVYAYLVELNQTRAKADAGQLTQNEQVAQAVDPYLQLTEWNVASPLVFPIETDLQNLKCAAQGYQVAKAMVAWLRKCRWPPDEPYQAGLPIGITWPEIALAVSLELGAYLPVKRRLADCSDHHLVWLDSFQTAKLHATTLREQGEMACQLLKQVVAILQCPCMPETSFGRVRSLYILGDSQASTGLARRPQWPNQHRVVHLVRNYLVEGRHLPDMSMVPRPQPREEMPNNRFSWEERSQYARQCVTRLRNHAKRGTYVTVEDISDARYHKG